MIILNTFRKMQMHPLLYVVFFLGMITGYFKECILFMIFIFVHEMGHVWVALYYKWNISKIIFLPLGGITIFEEKINKPMKEELYIAAAGIFFQTIFYFIVTFFCPNDTISFIHYSILLFNLVPIYPLDGSKIINLFMNVFLPFRKSFLFMLFLSFLTLLLLTSIYYKNLVLLLGLFFLWIGFIKEYRKRHYQFQKFLLERYMEEIPFSKKKKIKGPYYKKMKRDYKHSFIIENKEIKERQFLRKLFDNHK
ncbi:MAG: site-2 protease family protein [Bacilli bacterium]|nr:site-2 protease family protein [Bacilli bacterium]